MTELLNNLKIVLKIILFWRIKIIYSKAFLIWIKITRIKLFKKKLMILIVLLKIIANRMLFNLSNNSKIIKHNSNNKIFNNKKL